MWLRVSTVWTALLSLSTSKWDSAKVPSRGVIVIASVSMHRGDKLVCAHRWDSSQHVHADGKETL